VYYMFWVLNFVTNYRVSKKWCFFHVFLGSKNLIFDLIWTQSSQNIDLCHFGKIFIIRIQKKVSIIEKKNICPRQKLDKELEISCVYTSGQQENRQMRHDLLMASLYHNILHVRFSIENIFLSFFRIVQEPIVKKAHFPSYKVFFSKNL
jgi:hypothetical protein